TVFVHVRDAAGELYSQRDAPPGNGFRPTTSWLAGEYVVDEYTLDLPEGGYSLAVGLYDQRTGERLALPRGADQVALQPARRNPSATRRVAKKGSYARRTNSVG